MLLHEKIVCKQEKIKDWYEMYIVNRNKLDPCGEAQILYIKIYANSCTLNLYLRFSTFYRKL